MLLLALLGCQQDLILAMGDLTGVAAAAERGRSRPPPPEVVFELPREQPEIVMVPIEGAEGGVGGAARPPSGFNPVSVPQVPEETGVRFEGVRSKNPHGSIRNADMLKEFRNR